MEPILHINTALEMAFVAVSDGRLILAEQKNPEQKSHASFLHPAIEQVLLTSGIGVNDLKAVSVIAGPGSYTGLRVGLSAAKGICFVCSLPLIMINTLEWMMTSVIGAGSDLICPLIDARRDEVFTALYDSKGIEIEQPHAHILTQLSFANKLTENKILFFGNGAEKTRKFIIHKNADFLAKNPASSQEQVQISLKHFESGRFSDLTYAEPLYVKEFYSTSLSRPA